MSKGENALALFEDYNAKGIPPPEGLLPPPIMDGYAPWYEAFWKLNTDRQFFEGGAGPIPFRSISMFPGISSEEMDFFAEMIWKLDKLWLAEYAKDNEAAIKGKKRRKSPRKVLDL